MNGSLLKRASALAAAAALASTTALSSGLAANAATSAPDPKPAVSADRKAANDALKTVRDLLTPMSAAEAQAARNAGGTNLTMALRDLSIRADSLGEDDRETAARILARPTGGDDGDDFTVEYGIPEAEPVCTPDICVHYVTGNNANGDAPPLADVTDGDDSGEPNGIPDYIDAVVKVTTDVHDTYLDAGYREPLPDGNRGGDDRIDIYIAEIGNVGAYGYCTSDQPKSSLEPGVTAKWAYCVLDDDYAGFPNTPAENIKVTAAHEYFHATQYAYDETADSWLLEATAAWVEDEVYDNVNDNRQYLSASPISAPFIPMDSFISNGKYSQFHYGTWTFFRYLTEKYSAPQGTMPKLVLNIFKRMDTTAGGRRLYSYQAVNSVLKSLGTTAADQFLAFSVANRRARQNYDEGKALNYPNAPLAGRKKLTSKNPRMQQVKVRTDHLTSATYRIVPKGLKKKSTKLKVKVDMANIGRGSKAAVTVVPKKGSVKTFRVKLNKKGNGGKKVPFSSKKVKYVEVTLANASGRFNCDAGRRGVYSCNGTAKDDNVLQKLSARVK